MAALFRLGLVILLIEAIFFVLIWLYMHSTRRRSLEREWDRRHPDRRGHSAERREFVRRAMSGYGGRIRIPLFLLVIVVPFVTISTIIIFVNYR
ncbi:hypothetical protein PE067_08025 [Paracoccus sp. DMF-8]|uniref:hypothetical protein n=1 Tax=Paracoccus sp. DMF-8 TaxID=3019445 RepID=UPI0023E8F248|nr:hypothetical protein [Paracoccus sp. DMF-8]MDF3606076.1 hypothetical protein [Paracoccus sp. DMF-8]